MFSIKGGHGVRTPVIPFELVCLFCISRTVFKWRIW